MTSNDRFLVTGALGCIGAWTVRELVREGTPVVAFDLGSDARRLRLIMTPEELATVTFETGDITDLAAVERVLDEHGISHIVHLAALQLPFCRADPPLGARVNVVGTVNIFEAASRRLPAIRGLVYASSVAVFDAADADEVTHGVDDDDPAHPLSHYGVYKQANEGSALVYWRDAGLRSVGVRPAGRIRTRSRPGADELADEGGRGRAPRSSVRDRVQRADGLPVHGRYRPDIADRRPERDRRGAGVQPRRLVGDDRRGRRGDRDQRAGLGRPHPRHRRAVAVPRGDRIERDRRARPAADHADGPGGRGDRRAPGPRPRGRRLDPAEQGLPPA